IASQDRELAERQANKKTSPENAGSEIDSRSLIAALFTDHLGGGVCSPLPVSLCVVSSFIFTGSLFILLVSVVTILVLYVSFFSFSDLLLQLNNSKVEESTTTES